MTTLPSACPLDCPDRCSLTVEVEDDEVKAIRGDHRWAFTQGYICAKVAGFGQRVHGPERIRHPMIRTAAGFRQATWTEAMDLVEARFREIIETDGPEAIMPVWYGGSNGLITGGGVDQRLWNRMGFTRCLRTLCAANTGAGAKAVYGNMAGSDLLDIDESNLVIVWGMNPSASGIHLLPLLKRLKDRGGSVVVVDPRATPLARGAALHLPVLPGTDVPLALSLMHVAFTEGLADEAFLAEHCEGVAELRAEAMAWTPARAAEVCGVPAADIQRLARLYAAATPAMIRCGWGPERNRNGTDSVRAVLMLPAVFGKLGLRGGGYALSTSAGYGMDSARWQGGSSARAINLSQLGRALEETVEPPIRATWIYNCNPAATVPDQQRVVAELSRPDRFVVVHEQVWTDTCELADVVLPATTFLEHKELSKSYSGYVLQWSEPVIPPVGESRSNHDVLQELGARLGSPDPISEEDLAEQMVATSPHDLDWARLREERALALPRPVQMVDTRPEGKICLAPPPLHRPPPVDADLPLILISPATAKAISSTMYETERGVPLAMHPEDAAARELSEGDPIRIFNPRGEVRTTLHLDPNLRTGVVSLPKGLWRRATANGWTSNALISDHVDATGGGACYNDARVEVAPR